MSNMMWAYCADPIPAPLSSIPLTSLVNMCERPFVVTIEDQSKTSLGAIGIPLLNCFDDLTMLGVRGVRLNELQQITPVDLYCHESLLHKGTLASVHGR